MKSTKEKGEEFKGLISDGVRTCFGLDVMFACIYRRMVCVKISVVWNVWCRGKIGRGSIRDISI